jgi:carbamoyltransferase
MLICGIKVSHDGGVALIDGNRLVFSVEVEKLDNNHRYHSIDYLDSVTEILRRENVDPADVDRFVIDGWWSQSQDGSTCVRSKARGRIVELAVAPYIDAGAARPCLERYSFRTEHFGFAKVEYSSYHHATGHLLGCYCSSPFAKRGEDALILVWDGGMVPRLYQVTARTLSVRPVGGLLPLVGNVFGDFCGCFEPFAPDRTGWTEEQDLYHRLSTAGKAMAYAALGQVEENAFSCLDEMTDDLPDISVDNAQILAQRVANDDTGRFRGMSSADIICTFQAYLGRRLLRSLVGLIARYFPREHPNLGMAGGCALNIKWNRMVRDSGIFGEVWVPPFPNDSGAAIGAASAEMFCHDQIPVFDWNVYCGPLVDTTIAPAGWSSRPCDERGVAEILHTQGEPVVVLSGRAELGPRALGNRSILAPATDPNMKDRLNRMKGRESYRPIAPICLESSAREIFDPGTPDPYMLFEHQVRGDWARRIPAVIHLDGTARLQTIEPDGCRAARILSEYELLSGIPVLCNTSANFNGCGFFPDLASAAKWGKTKYIWQDGTIYLSPLCEPASQQ